MPVAYARSQTLFLLVSTALMMALGCASEPLPLAAQAGATIAIPVSGEFVDQGELG